MKTRTKALLLTLCAALLVCATVLATMAFLTDTATVTNTFTVGNVGITLDEARVDLYGEADGTERVTENAYKLIPGKTYTKDPTIHVATGSENCYLFVEVKNDIADALISINTATEETIAAQMTNNGWSPLAEGSDIYYQESAKEAGAEVPVFSTFTVSSTATNSSTSDNATIVVTAYAVQADGFDTAEEAWNATFGASSASN